MYIVCEYTHNAASNTVALCVITSSADVVCHFTKKKFYDGDDDSNMGSSISFDRKGVTFTEVPITVLFDHSCILYMYLSSSVLGSTEKGNERT